MLHITRSTQFRSASRRKEVWFSFRVATLAVVFLPLVLTIGPWRARVELAFAEDQQESSASSGHVRKKARSDFPGYGRYRSQFETLCKRVRLDNRAAHWQELLVLAENQYGETCRECRALYRAMACTEKKSIKQPVTETPSPQIPKRIPSTEVLASISDLFVDLAAFDGVSAATADGIDKLVGTATKKPDASPGVREYFDVIFAYMQAPFVKVERKSSASTETTHESEQEKQQNLENLF